MMKRDIRDLFKEEGELKTLPNTHRAEFINKLNKQSKETSARFPWLSVAAAAIIAISVGFSVLYNPSTTSDIPPMIAQIQAVEAQYLEDIDKEWQNFIALTNDDILVARFEKRLNELDKDYQIISSQFKQDSNNVIIIESLIENLKTRLQLLKDIQNHIRILNQNNEHHEKSI